MSQPTPDLADLSLLSGLAPELASTFVKVASDIALVIGDDGVIRNVAEGQVPVRAAGDPWVGRAWVDTVTPETRRKVELLLHEARTTGVSKRREVNHPGAAGHSIPVSWAAVRLGVNGPVLAVGRDLRSVAAIQQRLLDAQQDMERDYWQRRQAEARYRLLFQVARDAVMVVDAATLAVLEANPTASALFGPGAAEGGHPAEHVDPASRAAVEELFVTARASGRASEVRVRLAERNGEAGWTVAVSATPFRADDRQCLLVRARHVEPMTDFFEHMPEAAVITDSNGRIRMANPAFVALARAGDESRVRGWLVGDALGDVAGRWAALLAQVRAHGIIGRAAVTLRVAGSPPLAAEVTGALLAEGDQEDIGFTLHLPKAAPVAEPAVAPHELVARLGQAALPELLVNGLQWVERLLIESALERASHRLDDAAALLAIPPESLFLRMQRLGLASPPASPSLLN